MSLSQIAADLRRQATRTDKTVKTKLSHGLALSYKRIDGQCTLVAGHPDVHPSDEGCLIIARAFGVPVGTDPEWSTITPRPTNATLPASSGGGAGGGGNWHIITWRWIERDPAHQPALIPTQPTYP